MALVNQVAGAAATIVRDKMLGPVLDKRGVASAAAVSTPASSETLRAAAAAGGFKFGAAFKVADYTGDAPYAQLLRDHCDIYCAENEFKDVRIWTAPSTYSFASPDAFAAIAAADGKLLRAHSLLYPVFGPAWNDTTNITPGNCRDLIDAYFAAVIGRYPQVWQWDVVNELFAGNSGSNIANGYRGDSSKATAWFTAFGSGDAFLQYIFQAASALTSAPLFYCDTSTEQKIDGYQNSQRSNIIGAMTRALQAGCRIDGFSMQCHLRADIYNGYDYRPDRAAMRDFLVSLKSLGLRVSVTEFDVAYPSAGWTSGGSQWDQRAADYASAILDTFFDSGVTIDHVSTWGLSDKYTWLAAIGGTNQRPLPFDTALAKKPMFTSMVKRFRGHV